MIDLPKYKALLKNRALFVRRSNNMLLSSFKLI